MIHSRLNKKNCSRKNHIGNHPNFTSTTMSKNRRMRSAHKTTLDAQNFSRIPANNINAMTVKKLTFLLIR